MKDDKQTKFPLAYAMIGIITLIVAIAGSTYAYYQASVSKTISGTAGGGAAPGLTVTKVTSASGNLIPLNKGDINTAIGRNCVDTNGYTACQVYSVKVTNNSNNTEKYNIDLTSLTGTNTPNIEAATMGTSSTTITNSNSIKGKNICITDNVTAGNSSALCYFVVYINNKNEAQQDKGAFSGTVTATSTNGGQTVAKF